MIIKNTNGSGKYQIVSLDFDNLNLDNIQVIEVFKDDSTADLTNDTLIDTTDWSIKGRVIKIIIDTDFIDIDGYAIEQFVASGEWKLFNTKDIVEVSDGN